MKLKDYMYIENVNRPKFAGELEISSEYLKQIMNGKIPSRTLAVLIETKTKGLVTVDDLLYPERAISLKDILLKM